MLNLTRINKTLNITSQKIKVSTEIQYQCSQRCLDYTTSFFFQYDNLSGGSTEVPVFDRVWIGL